MAKTTASSDTKAKPSGTILKNAIDELGNKGIWLLIGLVAFIVFVVYQDFILSKKLFLYKDIGSDTLNFYYPYFYLQTDYLEKNGFLSWSFQYGMGQSAILFYLGDLFNIIFHFAPINKIAYLIGIKEVLKIFGISYVFYKYLKLLGTSNTVSLFGSLVLCFSSYTILGGCWYIFSYDVFCMALLLLSVEIAIRKNNFFVVPIAIFLVAISQPFNLYIFSLFLLGYLITRFLFIDGKLVKKDFLIFLGKLILSGGIGLLIAFPLFLENLFQMLESPRGSGETSYAAMLKQFPAFSIADKAQIGTSVMRFFSSDMVGTGNSFKGFYNYLEAPMFYCGLPCLLLLPQIFSFLTKKNKIVFSIVLAFWILPILFPYFRYTIWLYLGDYYRAYSFMVAMIVIFYSVLSFDMILKKRQINLTVLIVTLISLFALMSINYFQNRATINTSISFVVKILIVVYAAVLWLISKSNNVSNMIYIFFALLVFELTYFSYVTVNKRDIVSTKDLTQRIGYNDYTKEAVDFIKKTDKSPFYRIDKLYFSTPAMNGSLNDAMIQNYYSTTSYSSFNQKYFINYLQETGAINKANEYESRWPQGLINRPVLQSLNSVKYMLTRNYLTPNLRVSHDSVAQFGDIKVFKHKYILPMGYGYSNVMKKSDFSKASVFEKDYLLLNTCFIDDEDYSLIKNIKSYNIKDTIPANQFTWDIYKQRIDQLNKDAFNISKFSETHIVGNINASGSEILYLSIPFDKGWHLKVDNKPEKILKINGGMSGVELSQGTHNIELNYELPYFFKGLMAAGIGAVLYIGLFLFRKKLFKPQLTS